MNPDDHRREGREVAFFGRTTAGISHEFMNVLATIRESSGLIEDLLALDETSFPCRERLSRTLHTIRGQVDRGMEVSGRLNRFAHSVDDRAAQVEVNGLLGQIASLMERHADMREIEVSVEDSEYPVMAQADPVRLLMTLAACIEYCLDQTAGGGLISLACQQRGEQVAISCMGNPGLGVAEPVEERNHGDALRGDAIDGTLHHLSPSADRDGPGLELVLPLFQSSS